MQEQNNLEIKQPKKLFGMRHPLLKALVLITFVLLTGGLGLIVVLVGLLGDHWRDKRKASKGCVIALCALMFASASVHAQTWSERQAALNEMYNQRQELFLQQQAMEEMRMEQEQAMREQQREMEMERYREEVRESHHDYMWGYGSR